MRNERPDVMTVHFSHLSLFDGKKENVIMSEIKHERKNLTKVTALLLCLLSVASVCSCGETPQTDDTQSSTATSDESSTEETK